MKVSSDLAWFQILCCLVLCPVVLLFMIKPLFYRDPKTDGKPQRLKESAEPFLFQYVAAICESVGAPIPRSIRVNCDVNASASFRRGFASMFSEDLTLTIGLPLVAGMTVRELTGVLAHEFGHFAQTTGMRASFVTAHINYWFSRAVYKRDGWDEQLANASRIWDPRIAVFVWSARAGVWLSRQVMYVLAWLGNAISCLMMRQMEFDADRYEARMVGSKSFGKSTQRLVQQLAFADFMAMNDLQRFSDETRLADNLPRLVVSNVPHITPEIRKALREFQRTKTTGLSLIRTRPIPSELRVPGKNERLESGRCRQIWRTLPPRYCSTILIDFAASAPRNSTKRDWVTSLRKSDLRRPKTWQVNATRKSKPARRWTDTSRSAFPSCSRCRCPKMRPKLRTAPRKQCNASRKREALLKSVPEYRALCHRLEKAESLMLRTGEALACLDCGLRIRADHFGLKSVSRKDVQETHERARDGVQNIATRLMEFETNASVRLTNALQLLNIQAVASRLENAEAICETTRRFVPEALFISGLISELLPVRILFRRLAALYNQIERNKQNRRLVEKIIDQMQKTAQAACRWFSSR